ncbi:YeiH family protein [Brachybacterium sp. J153]|uniref:YeiH family protein n=1 Tax=Brachybacterium sp. J153 TaxID=3116488 RepID=UPI002E770CDF|nr:putative sulfate exporter family transporter [Brachybacterium sp. J153]MEE1617208.1 putative sulfate exporter family transporter [Brachybacterium sp. J153]
MHETLSPAASPADLRDHHPSRVAGDLRRIGPGLLLALGVAGGSMLLAPLLPGVSALVVAIVVGIVLANAVPLPEVLAPGLSIASKRLLRIGIVLLGLEVALGDLLALGAPMLLVVLAVVTLGILGTVGLGRLLGVERGLTLLIACGFSICGAAAVAAAAGVTDPEDEHEERTITAIALVVLCGTVMIAAVPALAALLHLAPETAGLWAGATIHEVAQVVAAGGALGGGALAVAVVVKLARVVLLAPVIAVLGVQQRRAGRTDGTRPPLVPLFVLGFLAMVALRSLVPLPTLALEAGSVLQTLLLAAAMFALGTGVRLRRLVQVGGRPFALAALSTLLVAGIGLGGVLLVG